MDTNQPFSLDAAWERLRKWALFMLNWLGPPRVFARLTISAAAREDIVARLEPLEMGVRRALLLEALALPKPEAPAPRMRASQAAKPPAQRNAAPGVSFRLRPRGPRVRKPSRRFPFRPRPSQVSAAPLARRFEAVLRVLNDRARYAARLAAHIHAEPAGTRFQVRAYRARSRQAAALLHGVEAAAARAVLFLNHRWEAGPSPARLADDG